MQVSPALKQAIARHAHSSYPQECCGLLIKKKRRTLYVPGINLETEDPANAFRLDYYATLEKHRPCEALAIVHSHTDRTPGASEIDQTACRASGLPWIIYSVPFQHFTQIEPNGQRAPLIGRQWAYGVQDCYTLLQDAMAEVGITLRNYPRQQLFEWNQEGWNLYLENVEKEGFVKVAAPEQKYDLLLFQIDSPNVNHAGIYWNPQRGSFIQHLINRESSENLFGGWFERVCVGVYRHKELMGGA